MPVLTFDNGHMVASRVIVCRACNAKIRIEVDGDGGSEHDKHVRAHTDIMREMDRVLGMVATVLGWANVDNLNRADCPLHKDS